jgi:hypothetical protein
LLHRCHLLPMRFLGKLSVDDARRHWKSRPVLPTFRHTPSALFPVSPAMHAQTRRVRKRLDMPIWMKC